jgi:D-sedoheptulose 7-phosphate isomerase
MTHSSSFFSQIAEIASQIDVRCIETLADSLVQIRIDRGRLFILGVGGSAANASHAVNDFRKLCAIEAYAPTDNVSELTARTNDDGWETVFLEWLKISRLNKNDGILVLSVGGGNREQNVSVNLINALDYAKNVGASIMGIVGRDGGYTAETANVAVVIPTVDNSLVTPHTEAYQAVVWHCLVSHPKLQVQETKW